MTSEIETFLDEIREAGKVRGLLTEDHIAIIRSGLIDLFNAAGEFSEFVKPWDDVRNLISNRSLSVKQWGQFVVESG